MKTTLTDIFLQVKINGDMPLLQAIEMILLEEEEKDPGTVFDKEFIENTDGYDQLFRISNSRTLNNLAKACGIDWKNS